MMRRVGMALALLTVTLGWTAGCDREEDNSAAGQLGPEIAPPQLAPPGAPPGMPQQPDMGIQRSADGRGMIPPEAAQQIMDALVASEPGPAQQATMALMTVGDLRFVSVLIDALRAAQVGIAPPPAVPGYCFALQVITQEPQMPPSWQAWATWYADHDLQPPPGYVAWKGRLLSRIDPQLGAFFENDPPINIRPEEIVWGGVKFEGIPALDEPKTIPAAEADYLEPNEPVFGIVAGGVARAYPQRILDWHEMVNDTLGDTPVSLAYCTLCGAGVAYDGRVSVDGETQTLTFGSSGLLYRSNKLMVDRITKTLWNQLTGKPVMGDLVAGEVQLKRLPVVVTTWVAWKREHPDTTVLSLETGHDRDYNLGAAYGAYFASPGVMFPVTRPPDTLAPKDRVFVVRLDDAAKAYPLAVLTDKKVVTDTIGDHPVTLVAGDPIAVTGTDRRSEQQVTYTAGAPVRAYAGHATTAAEADALPRLPGHLVYWFALHAHEPDVPLYSTDAGE